MYDGLLLGLSPVCLLFGPFMYTLSPRWVAPVA